VAVGEDGKTIAAMLEETKAAEYHVDGLILRSAETPVGGRYKTDEETEGSMEWRHEVETAQSQLRRFLVRFKRYNNREGMDV
jgi:hypothetical protein